MAWQLAFILVAALIAGFAPSVDDRDADPSGDSASTLVVVTVAGDYTVSSLATVALDDLTQSEADIAGDAEGLASAFDIGAL